MSNRLKKVLSGAGILAAFGLGGAAIAGAQGEKPGGKEGNETEQKATGADADRAGKAAVDSVGGGEVVEVEKETPEAGAEKPEPGEKESAKERAIDQKTAFSVEVKKTDGKTVDVALDDGFNVLSTESDTEDESEQGAEAPAQK